MRTLTLLVSVLALGCSSSSDESSIERTYHGDLVIQHINTPRSVFAVLELNIDPTGDVSSSRATSTAPTSTVGEIGMLMGASEQIDSFTVETTWQLTFPTLGQFTMSGTLFYSEATSGLAGNLTTRDETAAYVGMTTVNVQP